MRVLVLGGTGAMGEPLVRLLSERGDEVYVTTRRKRESNGNVHFLHGDAHNVVFIQEVLKERYDALVDFMAYNTEEFQDRAELYLKTTDQYLFLSSARVYADSKEPITEDSPRLLDICKDKTYLKTDEYALAKARAENILFNSEHKNWTIIRPYITYNTKRIQLGGLEIGAWASRINICNSNGSRGKTSAFHMVLPKDIAYQKTTLTSGNDVARGIVKLIANPLAIGEAFHITGDEHMRWVDIANIYRTVICELTGKTPLLFMPENSLVLSKFMNNYYQIQYDRKYNRSFDNSKFRKACMRNIDEMNHKEKESTNQFISIQDGLRNSLSSYLELSDQNKLPLNCRFEAYIDRYIYKTRSLAYSDFKDKKDFLCYLIFYYTPDLASVLKRLFQLIKG